MSLRCGAGPAYPAARPGLAPGAQEAALNPIAIGLIALGCTVAGTLLGMWLRPRLPEEHIRAESRDTMKLGIGLIATMTALVLGLVTASAKTSFDVVDTAVRRTAMDLLTLDRILARYGPETREVRAGFKQVVGERIENLWPSGARGRAALNPSASFMTGTEVLADRIRALAPRDESQRLLRTRAVELVENLLKDRWMVAAAGATSVPVSFLAILLFWLTITFAAFGLLAPRNTTVLAVLFLCAVSVSSAIFLVLEMDGPFDGLLKVSPGPLHYAHARLNQ